MLARFYWRIAEASGWTYPQIDELQLTDAERIAEQWRAEPPLPQAVRAYLGMTPASAADDTETEPQDSAPREVTEEEFRRIQARERAFAEKHGGQWNPFT